MIPPGDYSAVLADPPWSFKTYSDKGHTSKSAHGQYGCMGLDDIKAMTIPSAKDSYLFIWATYPMLPQALAVMDAWGFNYCTGGSWAKQSSSGTKWAFGTGYVLRNASEPFLIGKRGKPRPLSRSVRGLIVAPVREHSRKPDGIYDLVEALSPGPYLELFARQSGRENWTAWGNEVDKFNDRA